MGNKLKLERFQEGIHCYYRTEVSDCDYFEKVEYRMLCLNGWEVFLPLLMREENEKRWVLYRVDGRISLEEKSRQGDFNLSVCREIAKSLLRVMELVRENMLELSHICMKAEYIFIDKDLSCRWAYLPWGSDHIRKDMEDLSAWLLSKVDYDDSEAVKFVYHLHWCLRKEELSEDLLKNCLLTSDVSPAVVRSRVEKKEKEADLAEVWTGATLAMEEGRKDWILAENRKEGAWEASAKGQGKPDHDPANYRPESGPVRPEDGGSQDKDQTLSQPGSFRKKIFRGLSLGICICAVLGMLALAYIGNSYGFTRLNARYMMGLLLLAACSGAVFFRLSGAGDRQKTRDQEEDWNVEGEGNDREKEAMTMDDYYTQDYHRKTGAPFYKPGPGEGEVWPDRNPESVDEDGTVLLGIHKEGKMPALEDLSSGELRMIHADPWYIGSGKGNCHLWIDSRTVSRRHARIYRSKESQEMLIMDLNSTNGTKVNGITLIPETVRSLSDGDVIDFADHQYRFLSC